MQHTSTFPPELWASLIEKTDIRYTNNGLESFHSHLKNGFQGKNKCPNIFEVIKVLSNFHKNLIKLNSNKKLPVCEFDAHFHDHDQLIQGKINISEFLKKITKKYILPDTYKTPAAAFSKTNNGTLNDNH